MNEPISAQPGEQSGAHGAEWPEGEGAEPLPQPPEFDFGAPATGEASELATDRILARIGHLTRSLRDSMRAA